jgi:hypothetical protein
MSAMTSSRPSGPAIDDRADERTDEERGKSFDGGEQAHPERIDMEHRDGDQRQCDEADCRTDHRNGLAAPEIAQVATSP